MRSPMLVPVILFVLAQAPLCALGVWKAWTLRKSGSKILLSLAVVMAGLGFERVTNLIADVYRTQVIRSWIQRIPESQRPELWLGNAFAFWLLFGHVVCTACIVFVISYLFSLRAIAD